MHSELDHIKSQRTYAGRGAQSNPNNKFFANSFERYFDDIEEEAFLDDKTQTEFIPIYPKTIVNKVTSPDVGMKWSLNPYQGCEHGCVYCYARNSHEFWGYNAGVDFERKVLVKQNVPELLIEFLKKRKVVEAIALSGNTDAYQPAERKFKITRQCLEILNQFQHPAGIITKNHLVLRDLDILQDMASSNLIRVAMSITGSDEKVRRLIEPRTSAFSARLKAVEKLASAGVPVHVMVAPVIPSINDHKILDLIKAIADAGATTIGYTTVRLNGAIAGVFEDWIRKTLPDRADKVLNQIRDLHDGNLNDNQFSRRMRGAGVWADSIAAQFKIGRQKYLGKTKMPPYNTEAFNPRAADSQLNLF